MANEHHQHPIDGEWKARVREELARRGRGAASRLAEAIGCSTGQLTELLKPSSQRSYLVPAIHEHFGWLPPTATVPVSRDSATIRYLIDRATDEQRQYLLDAANLLLRSPNAESTQALQAMLRAFRRGFEPRRDLPSLVKILVVDGDDVSLKRIEKHAAQLAERVALFLTDNTTDGALLVGALKPDLVVVDAALDAVELCRHIRSNVETAQTRVVIATTSPSQTLDSSARKAGALGVRPKPLDLIALLGEFGES